MNRLWILSDLHLPRRVILERMQPVFDRVPDADVAIVAGDLAHGDPSSSMRWLGEWIRPHMRVICVLGNHEFYSGSVDTARAEAAEAAKEYGIDLLDDASVEIDDVRFVGSTLWTDYKIYAGGDDILRQSYMQSAMRWLNDHQAIRRRDGEPELFKPKDAAAMHSISRAYIDRTLAEPFDGSSVVVTHHAPAPGSVSTEYAGDPLTPAFVSDLSELIERHSPAAWVHGHTHQRHDYSVGGTRVICNPRGYGDECYDFDPHFVVDMDELVPKQKGP